MPNYWHQTDPDPIVFINSISGATQLASRLESDFALLELSARPPADYNVYYSGWDRRNDRPKDGAVISHPKGKAKTIALCKDKATRAYLHWQEVNAYMYSWKIKFSAGTVRNGSSGAPFFNSEGRIVGQYMGVHKPEIGLECLSDFRVHAGRFDKSWDAGSSAATRLRDWLNPRHNTMSILATDGDEPCRSSYTFANANNLHNSEGSWGGRTYNGVYTSSGTISAGNNVTIQSGTSVEFYGETIVLSPGFTATSGCHFIAAAKPCQRVCNINFGKDEEEDKVIILDTLICIENNITHIVENAKHITEDDTDTIDIIENNTASHTINLYPNPNSGTFQLETNFPLSEITNLKITNPLGITVYKTQNVTEHTIQLQNSASGMFFVVINLKDGTVLTQKMMVQR